MNALKFKSYNQQVFSTRLSETLATQGRTLEQLSEEISISQSALQSILDGRSDITLPMLAELADALEVSPAWLAFGTGEQTLPTAEIALKLYADDSNIPVLELQAKYSASRPSEHPFFNQATWISEVDGGRSLAGYWAWVHEQLNTIK